VRVDTSAKFFIETTSGMIEVQDLADLLNGARMDAMVSQAELAKRIGSSQSTIARLESGAAKPNLSTLERIAHVLGLRVGVAFLAGERPRSHASRTPHL
jgi:transcriptional regulator with XRE-family HTH domain